MYAEAYQAYPSAAGDLSACLYACLNVALTFALAAYPSTRRTPMFYCLSLAS